MEYAFLKAVSLSVFVHMCTLMCLGGDLASLRSASGGPLLPSLAACHSHLCPLRSARGSLWQFPGLCLGPGVRTEIFFFLGARWWKSFPFHSVNMTWCQYFWLPFFGKHCEGFSACYWELAYPTWHCLSGHSASELRVCVLFQVGHWPKHSTCFPLGAGLAECSLDVLICEEPQVLRQEKDWAH